MTPARKFAYEKIMLSLRDEPTRWIFGEHTAHLGQMEVWVVNRYYGTRFKYGSIHCGEFNLLWWLFPWEWWRVRLIHAVERAQVQSDLSE